MDLLSAYSQPGVRVSFDNKIDNNFKNTQAAKPYKDPLRTWPLKGLAYSNELGAVVSPLSPKLGTALWVPALMYFGADIYDKYKNENTAYNPSGKRGFKEAVFQALASVVLPTVAVHSGQEAISHLNTFTKTGLSTHAKEEANEFALDFMEQSSLHKFENKIDSYKKNLKTSLNEIVSDKLGEYHTQTSKKKVISSFASSKEYKSLSLANPQKLEIYLDKKVDTMFKMREQLMNGEKPKELPKRLYKKFQNIQQGYLQEYGEKRYLGKSAKAILKDYENSKIFKQKMIKTAGGFMALALLVKPIDYFVEHIVISKTIEPQLDKFIPSKKNQSGF
ncbi:MAG: hypothetical protein PHV37_05390 [Candidatus Gastranaerophilales bacterium]|nr:hypothetical protein [Candidatus Gastranaerophilales bacterium]